MKGSATLNGETVPEALTRREREILAMLAEGLTTPEIAERLTLALSTVKWHLGHLYGKLGVNRKRQALTRARSLGLLAASPPPIAADVAAVTGKPQVPSAESHKPHNLPV